MLRRGKVQRNALAMRQATCCWLIDMDMLWPDLRSGIELGMSVGSCRARAMILGRMVAKKRSDSGSSSSFSKNECSPRKFHDLAYLLLYEKMASSRS